MFNLSLSQAIVPLCLKRATIIPEPKSSAPNYLNNHIPIALMSVMLKYFKRQHIKAGLPQNLDCHQFAYRANRSTEDTIASQETTSECLS